MSTTVGYGKSKGKAQTKGDDLENNSMGYGFI